MLSKQQANDCLSPLISWALYRNGLTNDNVCDTHNFMLLRNTLKYSLLLFGC